MRYLLRKSTESPQSKEMAPSNLPISSYLVEIHALMKKQKSTLKKNRFFPILSLEVFNINRNLDILYFKSLFPEKKIDRKGNMYICISS